MAEGRFYPHGNSCTCAGGHGNDAAFSPQGNFRNLRIPFNCDRPSDREGKRSGSGSVKKACDSYTLGSGNLPYAGFLF